MVARRKQMFERGTTKIVCTSCNEWLNIDNFREKGEYANGDTQYVAHCRACENKRNLERYHVKYKGNPARVSSYKYTLKTNYGLTQQDFQTMFDSQQGKCAICATVLYNVFTVSDGKRGCVDHCHHTGKVRGLLCNMCNSGIGKLKDDPKLIRKALVYLEKNSL